VDRLIPNPIRLGFHPPTLIETIEKVDVRGRCQKKHDHDEDWDCEYSRLMVPDVPLKKIFADSLMRTLWMAAKARHLTSQYFRMDVVRVARAIRKSLPITSDQLGYLASPLVGGYNGLIGRSSREFGKELYPYVIWALMDQGLWPYIIPANANPPTKLEWEFVPRYSADSPHPFEWNQHYEPEHKRQALERPQYTRCDICHKPITDAIHQLKG
jgi:hypothetical protein